MDEKAFNKLFGTHMGKFNFETLNLSSLFGGCFVTDSVFSFPSDTNDEIFKNDGTEQQAGFYNFTVDTGTTGIVNIDNVELGDNQSLNLLFDAKIRMFGYLKSITVDGEGLDNLRITITDMFDNVIIDNIENGDILDDYNLINTKYKIIIKSVGGNSIINNISFRSITNKINDNAKAILNENNIQVENKILKTYIEDTISNKVMLFNNESEADTWLANKENLNCLAVYPEDNE